MRRPLRACAPVLRWPGHPHPGRHDRLRVRIHPRRRLPQHPCTLRGEARTDAAPPPPRQTGRSNGSTKPCSRNGHASGLPVQPHPLPSVRPVPRHLQSPPIPHTIRRRTNHVPRQHSPSHYNSAEAHTKARVDRLLSRFAAKVLTQLRGPTRFSLSRRISGCLSSTAAMSAYPAVVAAAPRASTTRRKN